MLPKVVRTAPSLLGAVAATAATVLLAVTLLCAASGARAEGAPGAGAGSGRPHGPPPPEALDACQQKAAGAACSFTHDGHALTGVCWAPEDRPLACKPDHPPHQGGSGSGSGSGPRR